MLESGLDVRRIITHRLPVADCKTRVEAMRISDRGKIVLDWTGTNECPCRSSWG